MQRNEFLHLSINMTLTFMLDKLTQHAHRLELMRCEDENVKEEGNE